MQLDERGWDEVIATLAATFAEMTRIRGDASDRIAASGEQGDPGDGGDARLRVAATAAAARSGD